MALNADRTVRAALVAGVVLSLAACSPAEVRAPAASPEPPPLTRVPSPPEWRPGDRWVYDWASGTEVATKTVDVVEVKEVNTVRYYVVRVADLHHYFSLDLHWAAVVRGQKVEARMVPAQPLLAWPLEIGRQWTHQGDYEEAGAKRRLNDTFSVVTTETVEVPAGRFRALKIVHETTRQESDQYWYAPDVRWYVKWTGRRGDIQFEERLREYRPARPTPG